MSTKKAQPPTLVGIVEPKDFSFGDTPDDALLLDCGRSLRSVNIRKREWVLNGESVYYASADVIKNTLEYDFEQERAFDYSSVDISAALFYTGQKTDGGGE